MYEYDYRDIWGNLRLSFRDSSATPTAGVYKPPVLTQANDYDALGFEVSSFTNQSLNNFKYQKQERINDFGLNWNFFKYRYSDSETGRFWQIDPLADKYVYNSPYALQENKFGKGVELEGLELYDWELVKNPTKNDPTPNKYIDSGPLVEVTAKVTCCGLGFVGKVLGIKMAIYRGDEEISVFGVHENNFAIGGKEGTFSTKDGKVSFDSEEKERTVLKAGVVGFGGGIELERTMKGSEVLNVDDKKSFMAPPIFEVESISNKGVMKQVDVKMGVGVKASLGLGVDAEVNFIPSRMLTGGPIQVTPGVARKDNTRINTNQTFLKK